MAGCPAAGLGWLGLWLDMLFGGVDDTFSRVLRKPLLKLPGGKRWREFQLALFIFIAFMTFLNANPEFCQWICPFKSKDEVLGYDAAKFPAEVVSYGLVVLGFLIALPILTKKRTFCSALCPFGALPPLIHRFFPHRVVIDSKDCSACGKCEIACPSFAIEKKGKAFEVNRYCTLCLRCVSACPEEAISLAVFRRKESRLLPFISLALGGALSLFYMPQGLTALAHFIRGFLPW